MIRVRNTRASAGGLAPQTFANLLGGIGVATRASGGYHNWQETLMTAATQTKAQPLGDAALELVEKQEWLDAVGDRLQRAVDTVYRAGGEGGRRVRDFLHGTWLGHPLHPALVDIPLGAWTTALVFDAASDGRDGLARAADTAIGVGIAGAVGAAATGLTDWQHTTGGDRRVGMAHALLNTAGLALYVTSLILRGRGMRGAGRGLAALGFIVATGAAYAGGHLVFRRRIGVDHAPRPEPWDDFVSVLPESDLAEGAMRVVEVRDVRVLLVRRGGNVY